MPFFPMGFRNVIDINNKLWQRFGDEDRDRLSGSMRRGLIAVGETIAEAGRPLDYAYFPTSAMLSSVVTLSNGEQSEAASIGAEGMVGLTLLNAEHRSPYRIVHQVPGEIFQIPAAAFRAVAASSAVVRDVIGRYGLTMAQQIAQTAACNLHHDVSKRLCRWLLTTADRIGRDNFEVTQEFLSDMLGVSRQSVNVTAGQLQQKGCIGYRRGKLRILDRERLERDACECYGSIKRAYEGLMGFDLAHSPTAAVAG